MRTAYRPGTLGRRWKPPDGQVCPYRFLCPAATSPGQLPCPRFSSFRRPLRRQGEPCRSPSFWPAPGPSAPSGWRGRPRPPSWACVPTSLPVRQSCTVLHPPGGEADLLHSYGTVSGRTEIPKPRLLLNRGGAWFRSGAVEIHLGVERECRPAGTAHPAVQMEDVNAAATRLVSFGPTSSGRERSRTSVAPRSRSRGQSPGIRAAGATGRRRLPALTGTRSGPRGHRRATAARPARRLISSMKQTAGRDPGRTPTHSGNTVPPRAL